jgi:hypothetical protein
LGSSSPEGSGEAELILQIKTEKDVRVYLREISYGRYVGNGWEIMPAYGLSINGVYSYNYLMSLALQNSGAVPSLIQIKNLATDAYHLPYYPALGEYEYEIPTSDVAYRGNLSEYALYFYDYAGYGSALTLPDEYVELERQYREFVHANYLGIDDETLAFMQGIISDEKFSVEDPDMIQKVASYIQQAATYNLSYNRNLDYEANCAVAFLLTYREGVCRHYATAATLLFRALGIPARYTQGYVGEGVAGEWVDVTSEKKHAWVEIYLDGLGWLPVEVTGSSDSGEGDGEGGGGGGGSEPAKTPLEICPVDVVEGYNGQPHYAKNELKVAFDSALESLLKKGYTYEVQISGSRTEKGESISTIESFTLYDPNKNDVTDQFRVVYQNGLIRVTNTQVVITLYSLQKYYDGTALSYRADDYYIRSLPDGVARVEFNLSGTLTDAGMLDMAELEMLPVTLYNERGEDVTENFYVKFEGQPLRVDRRAITLKALSESKVYDGTPLTNSRVELVLGELPEGHTLIAQAKGSITVEGTVDNVIDESTLQILDADGNDVTENYDITLLDGELTVLP